MKKLYGIFLVIFLLGILSSAFAADPASYFRNLAEKKVAAKSDAILLISMMTGKETFNVNTAVNHLIQKKIIKKSKNMKKNAPLTKGCLALLIMRAKNYGGGLFYSLIGGGRYAFRELVYRGVMRASGSENHILSGGELIGIISKVTGTTKVNFKMDDENKTKVKKVDDKKDDKKDNKKDNE